MKPPLFAPLGRVGGAAVLYLGVFGAALVAVQPAPDLGLVLGCAAPAGLAALLACTSQADRQQYVARLVATVLMLPIVLLMAFGAEPPLAATVALVAGHALAFVAGVFWLASATTRVLPALGTPRLSVQALLAKLQALPFVMTRDGDTWIVEHGFDNDQARSHRVLLDIDMALGTVYVREQLGASGAAPRDADERSMRDLGDEAFDAARPDARRVWLRQWQASILQPHQLQGGEPAQEKTADGALLQLCRLVLRCGWVWQPVLLKRR